MKSRSGPWVCCVQTVRQTCEVLNRLILLRLFVPKMLKTRSRDAVSSHCGPTPFKRHSQQSLWPYTVHGTQSAVTVALHRSRGTVSSHYGPTQFKGRSQQSLWPTPFKRRSQQSLWPYAVQGTQSAVTVALRRSRDAVCSHCGPTPFKRRSQQSLWPYIIQETQSAVTVVLRRSRDAVSSHCSLTPLFYFCY